MKYRRLIIGIFFAIQILTTVLPDAEAASARIAATLVEGSTNGNDIDPRISKYARLLKGPKNFTSLKVVGQSNANIPLPGSQTINLGSGHTLTIKAEESGANQLSLTAVWRKGKQKQQELVYRNATRNQPRFLGAGNHWLIVVVK